MIAKGKRGKKGMKHKRVDAVYPRGAAAVDAGSRQRALIEGAYSLFWSFGKNILPALPVFYTFPSVDCVQLTSCSRQLCV